MNKLSKLFNQKGALPPLILVAALGLLGFFLVAASFSFTKNPFNSLFPKPASKAASEIIFLDNAGNPISETSSATVNLDLFAPWPNQPSSFQPSPTPDPGNLKTTFILNIPNTQITEGTEFSVKVLARSENEEANLFSAKLNFDKDKLDVVSIDATNSFTSPAFRIFSNDNNTGDLFLIGGVPSPGHKTSGVDSELATVVFKAKQPGSAFLNFNTDSGIYSNTSNQNILETPINANFDILSTNNSSPTPTPTLVASPTASSSASPLPTNCIFTEANWESQFNPVKEGNLVRMKVKGNGGCENLKVKFKVVEDDLAGDDDAQNVASKAIFTNNEAMSSWVSEYQLDGIFDIASPPEYYFIASLENSTESIMSVAPNLTVVKIGENEFLKGDGNRNKVINESDFSVMMSWIRLTPETRTGFPSEIDINDDNTINIPDYSGLLLILKVNNVLGYRQLFTQRPDFQSSIFKLIPDTFAQTAKYAISVKLAEDSSFTQNVVSLNYDSHPFRTTYTFSDASLGIKTLFARFTASDGEIKDFSSTIQLLTPATMALVPNSGILNRGCNYSFNVDINTGGAKSDGADAIVFYDSSKMTIGGVTNGTFSSQSIQISQTMIDFIGTRTIGNFNLTVSPQAQIGNTALTFDFDPNNKSKTTDSNIVESGVVRELLDSVTNGNFTIGTGSCNNASPSPIAAKRVFVSSQVYDGAIGDLLDADAQCQNLASVAGLGGIWKAWLSSGTVSVNSRLNQSNLPYKLVNEVTIADNWGDLTDGNLQNPINIDQNGNSLVNQEVWTNTKPSGDINDASPKNVCQDWTSNSQTDKGNFGNSDRVNNNWTDDKNGECNGQKRIYCFEQ